MANKYYYNKDYFKEINTADKAYWLGFLYADGYVCRQFKNGKVKSMNLELTVCEKDVSQLIKFKNCLESNIEIHEKNVKLNNEIYKERRINVCSTEMCRDLIKLGCTPQKTYDIKFPTFDIVPKEYMRDFLRGFFDGDGCISTTLMNGKPHITLSISGMSTMLKSIVDFLFTEKIITTRPTFAKDKRREFTYNIYFHGTDGCKYLLDYLYKDAKTYLDRKYNKYIEFYKDYKEINKRGVYWSNRNNAYIVTICNNGERERIGQYKNLEDAINARREAERIKTLNSQLS